MYSLSLDHSGRSSHVSKERWDFCFSRAGFGASDAADCLWRMVESIVGAVGLGRLSAKLEVDCG